MGNDWQDFQSSLWLGELGNSALVGSPGKCHPAFSPQNYLTRLRSLQNSPRFLTSFLRQRLAGCSEWLPSFCFLFFFFCWTVASNLSLPALSLEEKYRPCCGHSQEHKFWKNSVKECNLKQKLFSKSHINFLCCNKATSLHTVLGSKALLHCLAFLPTFACVFPAVLELQFQKEKVIFLGRSSNSSQICFSSNSSSCKTNVRICSGQLSLHGGKLTTSTFKNSRYFIAFCSIRIHKQLFERNMHTILPVWKKSFLMCSPNYRCLVSKTRQPTSTSLNLPCWNDTQGATTTWAHAPHCSLNLLTGADTESSNPILSQPLSQLSAHWSILRKSSKEGIGSPHWVATAKAWAPLSGN